jgi:hypothetical protein
MIATSLKANKRDLAPQDYGVDTISPIVRQHISLCPQIGTLLINCSNEAQSCRTNKSVETAFICQ